MKNLFILSLAFAVTCTITACGGGDDSKSHSPSLKVGTLATSVKGPSQPSSPTAHPTQPSTVGHSRPGNPKPPGGVDLPAVPPSSIKAMYDWYWVSDDMKNSVSPPLKYEKGVVDDLSGIFYTEDGHDWFSIGWDRKVAAVLNYTPAIAIDLSKKSDQSSLSEDNVVMSSGSGLALCYEGHLQGIGFLAEATATLQGASKAIPLLSFNDLRSSLTNANGRSRALASAVGCVATKSASEFTLGLDSSSPLGVTSQGLLKLDRSTDQWELIIQKDDLDSALGGNEVVSYPGGYPTTYHVSAYKVGDEVILVVRVVSSNERNERNEQSYVLATSPDVPFPDQPPIPELE